MKRCRLIYRSKAKVETTRKPVLDDIARKAEANNKRDGIVGVLLLSGEQFLQ
ncbi:MAG: BLUF domain-containing protein, partial [Verrucomicrobiae bacterium]|nr:BLUF domain-containing protein [Verrucomicrobiae bacterium]